MLQKLAPAAPIAGIVGIAICTFAGLTRVAGIHYIGGFAAPTLFNVGVGLMVLACLIRLEALAERD